MSWFSDLLPPKIKPGARIRKKGVPEGVWVKCPECSEVLYRQELDNNAMVCPKCNHHLRMSAARRIESFLDKDTSKILDSQVKPVDILKFKDSKRYRDRLAEAQKTTGNLDAILIAEGNLHGLPIVVVAFDFEFMGGSMGSVVGQRFVQAVERSIENHCPLVCFSASGGARMQEAMYSLLQMAKTTAAVNQLKQANIPYISVLTDPTMGGVSASLGMLGDVLIAEPKALVGFAGERVITQTVKESLPEGFQRAEFLLEHGALDKVVDRRKLREEIHGILSILLGHTTSGNSGALDSEAVLPLEHHDDIA